ncbi:MAG TPA: endonuclease/exonuclease/phosphatase family protein, partial [Acidimicrobiia bacterium]|nr:endonuclease/exonuclease/phosphatase family protein [Acidimicrobiia bacterium]
AAAWPGAMPVAAARSRIGPVAIAAGPFLALQVLFLQSPAFVASSGRVSLATAVAVVLVGDVLAIGAVRFAGTRAARSWPVVAAGGAALATVGGLLPAVTGGGVVVLVWCAQVLAAMLAARAFGPAVAREPSRPAGAGAALGAGSLAFGLTVLLYQLHYDRPLPVSNRWLPAAAAVILAAAAVSAARRADPAPAAPAGRPRARLGAAALAGAVALGAVVVAGGLDRGELSLAPAVRAPVALRVVTYNPHEAVTRDGRLDPAALAATVQRLRPDVLVVEEAGRGWPLSSSIDLAEWLKRRLGMRYVWAPAADHQFGNALFSRVPILDARVVALPRGDGTMGRSAVIAHVGPVHGVVLTVVGTHLQNGSTRARKSTRVAELHVLLRALGPVRRTVLAGDLNSDPGSRELRTLLAAGFTTTQPTGRCTLHTSNAHCVDWILVTPDLDQGPVRTLPVDTFDHRPLSATVRPR